MAQNPKFTGLDGELRETYIYSTSGQFVFLTGTIDADTADLQVAIRGGGFSSDPDLVTFEGTAFTIPNPSAYPEGLELLQGDNTILVKSVLTSGRVTSTSSATVRFVTDKDIGPSLDAPTGIFIERHGQYVTIHVDEVDAGTATVLGYNFYASKDPGGGVSGYRRVNAAKVNSGTAVEVLTSLGEITVDASVALNVDGSLQADPQYILFTASQIDSYDATLQSDYDSTVEIPNGLEQYRATVTLEGVSQTTRFSFNHDRTGNLSSTPSTIPHTAFLSVLGTDPLYYVATAVFDFEGVEYESAFSPEVAGAPLVITPTVGSFPAVSRNQILGDAMTSILRSQPELDMKPGSFVRDTFLDPFSTEAERVRFIVDFLHRASSFTTLLAIDDPTLVGVSVPVNQSPYKQALKAAFFLESDGAVQVLIDNAFDKLASNVGVSRSPGTRSRGQIQVSIGQRPTTSITYGIGVGVTIGGKRYRLTSPVSISSNGSGASYNPATGRYTATAFAQAESVGTASNIARGQRGTIDGAQKGVSVTNSTAMAGGRDVQSNLGLATDAGRAVAGADTGTEQGYLRTAVGIAEVEQANVVGAGHPLMFRDLVGEDHVGGKVDVWLKGSLPGTATDTFAFTFKLVKDAEFEPVGDLQDLIYRVVDDRVTEENPLIEMLDYADYGFRMRNVTQSYDFDLTDVTVLTYDTVQLSADYNDPLDASITDIVTGSFRFRDSTAHTFAQQPVKSVQSFIGEVSGVLDSATYALVRTSDPLGLGRSTEAGDQLQVTDSSIGVPSSAPVDVSSEEHVILDGVEYLNKLGINPLTVRVYDRNRVTLYTSPYASDSTNDYTFIQGDTTTPLGIQLTGSSTITSGDTLSIDYSYDENYVVEYTPHFLAGSAQNALDPMSHATADVLAKQALEMPVDITATVVFKNTQNQSTSLAQGQSEVRTALSRYMSVLGLGEPVRQSDIARIIDAVPSVSYVVLPLTRMGLQDGTQILREPVSVDDSADYTLISDWSNSQVKVYLLDNPLAWPTDAGGGPSTEFRAVYLDGVACTHYDTAPNVNGFPLKMSPYGAFIIGTEGLLIPGVSDNDTLDDNYSFPASTLEASRDAKRVEITKNRVVVTLPADDVLADLEVAVTYLVYGHTGVDNIVPNAASYAVLGDVLLTTDEDEDFRARVVGR